MDLRLRFFNASSGGGHGLSADGRILVGGNPHNGVSEAWVAHIGALSEGALGDFNGDLAVDSTDLGMLLQAWGPCAQPDDCPGDLDGDGVVGGADIGLLLAEGL